MIAFLAALIQDRRLALWVAGALALVAGSAAPWAHIASPLRPLTELGLDADGKITILCGAAALAMAVAFARLGARDLAVGAVIASLVAGGLALLYLVRVQEASARVVGRLLDIDGGAVPAGFAVRAGLGVWVVLAGAIMVGAGAIVESAERRPALTPADDETPSNGAKR